MSKKYEIVTVNNIKRVKALRSWTVQGRRVNAGDVGGAVFNERTLSQDGDAWIFSGRLDNPLIRVGGDSVVNIGEYAPTICPFVNIFGTSSVDSNFNVDFATVLVSDVQALTPAMMEQGDYAGTLGNPITKVSNPQSVRKTEKVFTGGAAFALPAPATGYKVKAIAVDADGTVVYSTGYVTAGSNIPAGAHSYAYIVVCKSPAAATVPADVTAAALTFPNRSAGTINIVDSHVTLTGQNAGHVTLDPSTVGGENTTNIIGSTVQVNCTVGAPKLILACDLINTNANITMKTANITVLGNYRNVKNLVWSVISWEALPGLRNIVQATDCNNFVMDNANIDTAAAIAANAISTPYKFIRCNMNKAVIVNQPKINNTYVDINFDLATADLGRLTVNSIARLVSSNVNGMYRLADLNNMGGLIESFDSVKGLNLALSANITKTYNTTIYADAYLKGQITFEGTNVFGNAVKKPKTRTIDVARVAVQGAFNAIATGGKITGVVASGTVCVLPMPVNLRTAKGLTVAGLTGRLQAAFYCTNASSVISNVIGWGGDRDLTGVTGAEQPQCYVAFHYDNNAAIKPEDLAGVTIETYNGCKIVNAKTGTMTIAGNVRVEENAVLKDVSVTGSGYFGGNSVTENPTTTLTPMPIAGAVYMNDNAVFSPKVSAAGAGVSLLDMRDNAIFAGALNTASTFYNITMANNAEFRGSSSTRSGLVMRGNSLVESGCTLLEACKGLMEMEGNARVESGNLTAVGHITLTGDYRQTAAKVWTGKRVIDSQDAPQYDNNVKTQYDF